jgi:bifunctional UDP-N-acetylglucosamine pyrophosphorylase/glucosamine-1-phosphate N-acetyltransferase
VPAAIVILAAGRGTRMRSPLPKVLHEVAGRPMVGHVVAACLPLAAEGAQLWAVVPPGPDGRRVAEAAHPARPVVQAEARGTGHALACAVAELPTSGKVVVLNGDMPLVTEALVRRLARVGAGVAAALVVARVQRPDGFGRVLRGPGGEFARVVEEADATPEELLVREVNAGLYAFDLGAVRSALGALGTANAQGEMYLTDALGHLAREGRRVAVVEAPDPEEVMGVNTRFQLAEAAAVLFRRRARALGEAGVGVADPESVRVEAGCEVAPGAWLGPGARLGGHTRVAAGARVEASCLRDVRLAEGARVGAGTWIDPTRPSQGAGAAGANG